MTKQDIERILDFAERKPDESLRVNGRTLAALCRIALLAIAAREATREEVEHNV